MPVITERAPAKINLTLKVLGRRPDGYHELFSLVAFADAADIVSLDTDRSPGIAVSGPFAAGITGRNLLEAVLDLLERETPDLKLGFVSLEKRLPVAAGIGGGSADTAALLRAVTRANPSHGGRIDWLKLAARLGADVPVCLKSETAWMTGAGETVAPLDAPLPELHAVLVNPLVAVPADKTARVFRALAAGEIRPGGSALPDRDLAHRAGLIDFMRASGNDLAEAAEGLVPEIGAVLDALRSRPGIEHAAVSGAGPTCFGIFPDSAASKAASREIAAEHPDWWVVAATPGGGRAAAAS